MASGNDLVKFKRTWEQRLYKNLWFNVFNYKNFFIVLYKSILIYFSLYLCSAHPYLFFNKDGNSMTFFGINITPQLHLVNPETKAILMKNIIEKALYEILQTQMRSDFINLQTNFSTLAKQVLNILQLNDSNDNFKSFISISSSAI